MRLGALAVVVLSGCAALPSRQPPCAPLGMSAAEMRAMAEAGFELTETASPDVLAMGMTACLGAADPTIRDGFAFEGLSKLMRAGSLEADTVDAIRTDMLARLAQPDDRAGFEKPFAALVLSEAVRVDRISPYMSDAEFSRTVAEAAAYLAFVADYRGFVDGEGWRHGVAHGADVMLQLVLNPRAGADHLAQIREAVATQIAPMETSYMFGESDRLARPILYMALRHDVSEEVWRAWFERVTAPAPFADWSETWTSEAGLAKRHNTRAFLQAVYVTAAASGRAELDILRDLARERLTTLG